MKNEFDLFLDESGDFMETSTNPDQREASETLRRHRAHSQFAGLLARVEALCRPRPRKETKQTQLFWSRRPTYRRTPKPEAFLTRWPGSGPMCPGGQPCNKL